MFLKYHKQFSLCEDNDGNSVKSPLKVKVVHADELVLLLENVSIFEE